MQIVVQIGTQQTQLHRMAQQQPAGNASIAIAQTAIVDGALVLNVTAAIPNLTLLVQAPDPADTTLVVRTPTGAYLCNDDTTGYNPAISGAFAPGTYEVFVGAYSSDSRGIAYQFGVTEQAGATSALLTP